ncbi:hypothetical protein LCGC14_1164880 [marine sediment metagenome]|uniref:Uncharacterized protein n=1 Tax=marine sediment metagenome TaxID=412755 RepID=A0A0F9P9Q4_9ZZZZ
MDDEIVANIPEERVFQGVTALVQSGLRELIQELTPKQLDFLRIRAMTSSDTAARHILGHERTEKDPHPERECGCGRHKTAWVDMREATVSDWKAHDEDFSKALEMLLTEPLIYAGAQLQALAPKAVVAYGDLLEPGNKPEVRRLAAKDVVEATGLKATPGVEGSGHGVAEQFGFKVALERFKRKLELSDQQRELLRIGGIELDAPAVREIERDLDGNDVEADNSELLPD